MIQIPAEGQNLPHYVLTSVIKATSHVGWRQSWVSFLFRSTFNSQEIQTQISSHVVHQPGGTVLLD